VSVLNSVVHGERARPSALKPDVPTALDACVLRALEVDPEARYQDARGFRAHLLDILVDMKVQVQPEEVRQVVDRVGRGNTEQALQEVPTLVEHPEEGAESPTHSDQHGSASKSRPALQCAHRGAQQFWLRVDDVRTIGPIDYFNLVIRARKESSPSAAVSVDQAQWMPLNAFAALTSQETLLRSPDDEPEDDGTSSSSSTIGAMFDVSVRRLTGRLKASSREHDGRIELHVQEGRPSYVYCDAPRLQLPQFLIDESIVDPARMPRMMRTVVETGANLITVLQSTLSMPAPDVWKGFMQRRLLQFTQATTITGFDQGIERKEPFDGLLAKLLPHLVHQALSPRELRARLGDRIHARLATTQRCATDLASLGLDKAELVAATVLAGGSAITDLIEDSPDLETLYLYLGYVMLETGLLTTL
jgi:hypothetical protein